MERYPPNRKVRLVFDIPQTLSFVSGEVVVQDENEAILNTYTMDVGDLSIINYTHLVDEAFNDIGTATKGIRTVTMTLQDADGVDYEETKRYYLLPNTRLIKGDNSLMTFSEALLLVPDLTELNGWYQADDATRVIALREAYDTLGRFALNKAFVHSDITRFSAGEFTALDAVVQGDFMRAQLLHADFLLGSEPEKHLRDNGVISNSVGESTSFFRTTKRLSHGVSDRAYQYLSRHLNHAVRLANA